MKLRRILLIAIPIFIVVVVALYAFLGGFKQPEIKISKSPGYILLGKRYTGSVEDKKLKKTYREVQEKYKEGKLKGIFSVMHFYEPDRKEGKVDAVIGVIVPDSTQSKPKGYHFYVWPKKTIAEIVIRSHFSVAPSPEEVNEVAKELAKSRGYNLDKGSLEKYFANDHLVVEIPLVKSSGR